MKSRFHLTYTLLIIATWVLTLLGPIGITPVHAATLVVTNVNNSGAGSLRDTLGGAATGDTITFDASLSGQTIRLGSAIGIWQDVTIDGSALASPITISGDFNNTGTGVTRLFSMSNGGGLGIHTTIKGVVLDRGNAGALNNGGAIVTGSNNTLNLINVKVTNNTAAIGGAIWMNNGGTLSITNSTFSGNTATNEGGAIVWYGNSLTISNTTFSNNSAADGGAIYNSTGTADISNSTFAGNSATTNGGAIYNLSGGAFGSLKLTNTTFSNNSAASGGAIRNDGMLNFANTILANSTSGGDCVNTLQIGVNTHNLVQDGSCSTGGVNFYSGDPLLNPLANNGGSTQTMSLLGGSPAIDHGDDTLCSAAPINNLDQRGVTRPSGAHCDIGAYEAAVYIVTNNNDSGSGSLRDAITNVSAGTVIRFDAALAGQTITLTSPLNITRDMGVDASSLAQHVTVDGNNSVQVFLINGGITVTLVDLDITHGWNTGSYGGAIVNSGTTTILNSNIAYSHAQSNGGGIYNNGHLTVKNSAIFSNDASAGGGISNQGTLTMINSTIAGTVAYLVGGAIANNGTATLINSTLDNIWTYNGSMFENYGTLNFANTVMADAQLGSYCNNQGTIGLNINNFVQWYQCSPAISGVFAQLTPLADNGGGTQTMAPLPGSPLIDAANTTQCPALDQRGVSRPQGAGCDIGAFESRGFTLDITSGNQQSTLINTAFSQPLVVSVTSASGEPVDGGQVTFTAPASGASLTTTPLNLTIANGIVSATVAANGVAGMYNVMASTTGAASVAFTLTNHLTSTTTSISSTLNPAIVGQLVTFTATVTSTADTPSGSVQFYADGSALGSPLTLSNGQVSLSTAALTAGTHPITATYNGDASHDGSTSNTVVQVVNRIDTVTAIASMPSSSIYGQLVTFTATVTSTVDTPSGNVQFYADGSVLGSPVTLSNGQASLSTAALTAGTHPITATYSGDANYNSSTSNTIDQMVNPAGTTTSISVTPNPAIVGQAVTFTATVTSTVDTPSGSVQFYVDGSVLGSPVTLLNGQASLSTTALAVGTHPITATYSGDANYTSSTSNQADQVVNNVKVYLPLIARNFVNAPDLIVQSRTVEAHTLQFDR